MSVLTCPVCRGAMREMNKQGVLVDVCTQCRGVWLDRGELEKLAGLLPEGDAPAYAARSPQPQAYPQQAPYPAQPHGHYDNRRRDWDDDDDDDRRKYGYGGKQKSTMKRFLDFFD